MQPVRPRSVLPPSPPKPCTLRVVGLLAPCMPEFNAAARTHKPHTRTLDLWPAPRPGQAFQLPWGGLPDLVSLLASSRALLECSHVVPIFRWLADSPAFVDPTKTAAECDAHQISATCTSPIPPPFPSTSAPARTTPAAQHPHLQQHWNAAARAAPNALPTPAPPHRHTSHRPRSTSCLTYSRTGIPSHPSRRRALNSPLFALAPHRRRAPHPENRTL